MNKRIYEIRKTLRLSQDAFGKRIKISGASISKIESGDNNPSEQTLKLICQEFNVNAIWLHTGEGDMFNSEQSDMDKVIDLLLVHEKETAKAVFKALAAMGGDEWAAFKKFILTAAHEIEQSEQTKE